MPFKLTDTAIRAAKPKEKRYKLADGEGLYVEVAPTGASGGVSSTVSGAKRSGFPLAFILPWA